MRRLLSLALLAAGTAGSAGSQTPPPSRAADSLDIIVASTTDVHGWLRGWNYTANAADTTRGMSRVLTIVDSIRAANGAERVVLVDAGDDLQGTAITSVALRDSAGPNPIIAAMNATRYDAGVIGNHEFNYGLPYLHRAIAQARFPFLAANVYTPDGRHAYTPWVMLDKGGVRVAVVGGTTPGSMIWDRDKLAGRIEVRDIIPSVRAAVGEARARGADVVVVVLHSGLGTIAGSVASASEVPGENVSARVAIEIPGIDVIVFGHTHSELADSTIGGTLLTQPQNGAASVSVARLRLRRDGGSWRVVSRNGRVIRARGHQEHPAVLAATEVAHGRAVQYARAAIGSTQVAWRADSARVQDSPIIDFVLETQRRAAGSDLASAAAFNLNAAFGPGEITMANMAELYPYENNLLRAVKISGKQLKEYLEFSARYFRSAASPDSLIDTRVAGFNFDIVSGVDYVIDISKPIGSRITTLARGGKPVAETDSFTLALNDYRQSGGGGYSMLGGAPVVYDRQQLIRELLVDEIRRKGVLRPADYFVRNWRIEPDSLVGAAYRSMRRLPFDRPRPPGAAPATQRPLSGPRLRVISTNDIHGYLEPWVDRDGAKRGGAAALATVIARARAECPAPECVSLVVDAGDMMQGPALASIAYGKPVIEVMNAIGYDMAAVGNHEFDWGPDTLRARMREAHFPILSANAWTKGGDVPWIPNDTMLVRGGRRIGLIGLTTTTAGFRSRAGADGFRFPDPASMVDSISRALRGRGAEAVVVVSHAGSRCGDDGATDCRGEIIDLAKAVATSVDAIVAGDSHTLINTAVDGTPVVQARDHAQAVAVVDIPLGTAPRATRGAARHEVRWVFPDSVSADPAVAAIVQRAANAVSGRTSVRIGTLRDSLLRRGDEYALGRVITDAQRAAARGDIAIMNNGGIRADLYPGVLTYGMLFEVQPFGNRLHRITTTGAGIRRYLENSLARPRAGIQISGATVRFDTARARGSRILDIRLANGRALSDTATYVLILNEFMALGGDNFDVLKAQKDEALDVTDLDALVAYVRGRPGPVLAPREPRLVRVSGAAP